jgi:hypothetical protein
VKALETSATKAPDYVEALAEHEKRPDIETRESIAAREGRAFAVAEAPVRVVEGDRAADEAQAKANEARLDRADAGTENGEATIVGNVGR